ncbi:DKNYY domain-containing protein [Flavobacterium hercynium]|uniref:DKNYY family protein n=1 Tax=Flavobacterium hercynium TaxID=387094 RepID=A0A226GP95_9FLAO|nr:DKNYY domain-containing protein [Flavobacterium hercynium]OXA83843.1 hypothetical protein B0A66_22020 [Flavobacterium hercynium]
MKIIFIIAAVILVLVLSIRFFFFKIGDPVNLKVSNSYFHHYRKNIIVFSPMGNWFELGYFESDADVASFEALNEDFGKDKSNVYWKGHKQEVDHATFQIDEQGIIKDKDHVYNIHSKKADVLEVIDGADPKTYQLLDPSIKDYRINKWFKDANAVYYKNKKIKGDAETFRPVNDAIAVDANFVYAIISYRGEGQNMIEVDEVIQKNKRPEGEVHAINETYAQIGNSIVSAFTKDEFELSQFDAITDIKKIDYWTIAVNNILISKGVQYPEIDVNTFETLNNTFSKDKNGVYYNCKKIDAADLSSFEVLSEEYSKDAKNVYYKNAKVVGANPATFKAALEYEVWEDGQSKYKNGKAIVK